MADRLAWQELNLSDGSITLDTISSADGHSASNIMSEPSDGVPDFVTKPMTLDF
jgi:hypothetical protein